MGATIANSHVTRFILRTVRPARYILGIKEFTTSLGHGMLKLHFGIFP